MSFAASGSLVSFAARRFRGAGDAGGAAGAGVGAGGVAGRAAGTGAALTNTAPPSAGRNSNPPAATPPKSATNVPRYDPAPASCTNPPAFNRAFTARDGRAIGSASGSSAPSILVHPPVAAFAGADVFGANRSVGSLPSRAGLIGCSAAYDVSYAARRRLSRIEHASPSSPIALASPASIALISVDAFPVSVPGSLNHFSVRSTVHVQPAVGSDTTRNVP